MKMIRNVSVATTMFFASGAVGAADLASLENQLDVNPVESCSDGIDLYKEGDLKGAIELISLCHDELTQLSEQMAVAAFLDEVMGYKGDKIRQQNTMGFSQIERRYRSDNKTIEVMLNSGKAASMMQSFIGVAGHKTRIGKHSGYIVAQNDETTVFVPMDAHTVSFKSTSVDQKELKKFSKMFLKGFAK